MGVVPLRFKVEAPPAPAIQRPRATAGQPATPAAPPAPKEPAAPPTAALPPPAANAADAARKAAVQAPPARASEPLLLDENQTRPSDEEVLRYFRFPGADGGRVAPPPGEPPSSATYRQQ